MPLSWNEIKTRAAAFSNEWKDESNEHAEAKSFWDDFFNIFGISRRRVASFEQSVQLTSQLPTPSPSERAGVRSKTGFIDLLWKGVILIEHKSRGKNLDKAYGQAKDYFPGLTEKELPRYILVSDFEHFRLYDLETNEQHDFKLSQLTDHVHLFGFIAGYQKRTYKEQDPVNIEAAELMGKLHDKLKSIGYEGHQLELYLVRLVFCLFADDTNIFEKGIFYDFLDLKTNVDGSDLAAHLSQLFEILNTPNDKRLKNLDEALNAFPYVNGKLFEERLPLAGFDSQMRKTLMDCCGLDWGKISPAIFGSLFQSVMDEKARRNLGAHYTSEKNILKLIKPLFLDELWSEFDKTKNSKAQLQKLHDKISQLRFLDPACGCGNFLIIAYRELRLLEVEIIKQLLKLQGYREEVIREAKMDASYLIKCNVDQFYGIEYEEFPAQIARTAMWLMDHQMNMLVTETFGEYYVRLPLQKAATIVHGNALRIDWQSLIEPMPWEKEEARYHYILGNPPFIGKNFQTEEQKADLSLLYSQKGSGNYDYVTGWYIKAGQYLKNYNKDGLNKIKIGFVSTNSITQGEQVGILWPKLLNDYKVKIHFAHKTFKWTNEARGNAAVHVVIIGFSNYDVNDKHLFQYDNINSDPNVTVVKNINPYLVDAKDVVLTPRTSPICNVPSMINGSKVVDGGNLLFTAEERDDFLKSEPEAKRFIREFIGSEEYINNFKRYCLWLKNVNPNELKKYPAILKRIEQVRQMRSESKDTNTNKWASFPSLFMAERQPTSNYLLIPRVSSENRFYVPIGYLSSDVIISDRATALPEATYYHFGIITSIMHMCWMKYTCGRMKSDYNYSNSIVYNNFPWPESPSEKQIKAVEDAAQNVLDARAQFLDSSLADLYDPNTMPPALVKAHQALDKAVDLCYRPQPFTSETKRIEFLFELYDKYTAGLFVKEKKKKNEQTRK